MLCQGAQAVQEELDGSMEQQGQDEPQHHPETNHKNICYKLRWEQAVRRTWEHSLLPGQLRAAKTKKYQCDARQCHVKHFPKTQGSPNASVHGPGETSGALRAASVALATVSRWKGCRLEEPD